LSGTTVLGCAGARKVKPGRYNQSGFTGAIDSEWQWHQLGHMQICTLTQTTMPAFHHSVICRPDALHAAQPTALISYRPWKVLESPGIKMLRFPGLESPGKRHRSWKTSKKSWNSKVVVLANLRRNSL